MPLPELLAAGQPYAARMEQITLLLLGFTCLKVREHGDRELDGIASALSRAAPIIIGTMLGVQGEDFRAMYKIDLRSLFGIELGFS